jgi:tetratricopeptide (TPR) repeat protein
MQGARQNTSSRRSSRTSTPSTSAYMVAAAAASGALFFVLWWMLQEDENPWIPAGLAASVVMLVAASARVIVVRRAWGRSLPENAHDHPVPRRKMQAKAAFSQSEILRALEKQSAETNHDTLPDAHLRVFQLCSDFLEDAEKALASPALSLERRLTVRARQDRVRVLQKHHLLSWARNSALSLTHEAQQRVRLHEKLETANRAIDCIDSALKKYPDDEELNRSAAAVRDFMTSSRVAHWVELAQRASFKGHYRRAMDCYRDALFYLTRAAGDHQVAAEQITREIELLRARMATHKAVDSQPPSRPGPKD